MNHTLILILGGVLGIIISIIILTRPYIGVALTVASLPIIDLLPSIPYFSSLITIVGIITLFGFIIQKGKKIWNFSKLYIFGIFFIAWVYICNPHAAILGTERNWIVTFLQLWILMFLAGNLLDTPKKQQIVMVLFSITALISAVSAITSGSIGIDINSSTRSAGLTDNANAAARYFTVAMVFITYLRSTFNNKILKFITLLGIFTTYLGVFFTISRTGIALLFLAQIIIIFMQFTGKQRYRMIFVYVFACIILFLFSSKIFGIIESIIPSIISKSDTFGLRVNLWISGIIMWRSNPITGVGIGEFYNNVGPIIYTLNGAHVWRAVAHNTYIQILSETGIVGFILFMSMIINSLKSYLNKNLPKNLEDKTLRNAWLIAFIIMLLGGITKSDHADKLTWMVMGISTIFSIKNPKQIAEDLKSKIHIGKSYEKSKSFLSS